MLAPLLLLCYSAGFRIRGVGFRFHGVTCVWPENTRALLGTPSIYTTVSRPSNQPLRHQVRLRLSGLGVLGDFRVLAVACTHDFLNPTP